MNAYARGACLAVATLLSSQAFADLPPLLANARTVVVGANNAVIDLPAIQAAVNAGGSVLLQGTFDLGDGGKVLVQNDVDIGGETDASGAPLTIIRRGEWCFHTPYPTTIPPPDTGPVVAIHNLHFVQSRGTAIHLGYSGGAFLHNNIIDQMRVRKTSLTVGERAAIVVGTALLGGTPNQTFQPKLISGDIIITDNLLDTSGSESSTATRGTGMFVSMYVGADVRVERNVVLGNTRTGLAILDGTFDNEGRGSVVIAGNTIASDVRFGFIAPGPRAPIGIVTGFNNQRAIGADPNVPMIPVLITNNSIELNGVTSMGIVNIWNGAVISDNSITVHGDRDSTINRLSTSGGILATASNQVMMHNRIEGQGCNAIRYGGTTDGQERFGNVSKANRADGFEPFEGGLFDKCATYWLELASHDNDVVGNSGSAIDEGVNNRVTGFARIAGGVGHAISAAVHTAEDRIKELGTFGFE